MKLHLFLFGLMLSTLPGSAQHFGQQPMPIKEKNVQLKLENGSVVTGQVVYMTHDGVIVEMRTDSTHKPVWYPDVESVRWDKPRARWRKAPDAWLFQQRYDPKWKDPSRWEFGIYGDYGFGVGRHALDRYEVGLNVRYGITQYLFAGIGFGMNSMLDIQRLGSGAGVWGSEANTTGCSVFANVRGYFRNRGIRPFADLRLGYTFPSSTYSDNRSMQLSDKGMLMRFGAGAAYVGRNDIGYSLSVAYQAHSVKLTEVDRTSLRQWSESVALQFAVTFRF